MARERGRSGDGGLEAQAAGEVRTGDPGLMAFTIVGPLLLGVLWREVMEAAGGDPLDLPALAREHRNVLRAGLLPQGGASGREG